MTISLKWRSMPPGLLRTVYLGDLPLPAALSDCSSELNGLSPGKRQFLLWGERTGTANEWLEQQE